MTCRAQPIMCKVYVINVIALTQTALWFLVATQGTFRRSRTFLRVGASIVHLEAFTVTIPVFFDDFVMHWPIALHV